MKKTNLRLLLFFITLSFVNSLFAQQKVLKITQDSELSNSSGKTIKLFCNSTLKVLDSKKYVRITNVSENHEINQNAGIFQGAELEYTREDENGRVYFKDITGKERFDVKGVGTDYNIVNKYKVQFNEDTIYVPEEICTICEDVNEHSDVTDDFSYSPNDCILYVNAQSDYKIVVNNTIRKCGANQKDTFNDVGPNTTIRVIFSNENECFLDSEMNVSELKKDTPSSDDESINNFIKKYQVCIYITTGCLIIVILLIYHQLNKKNTDKKNIDKNKKLTKGEEQSKINLSSLKHDVGEVKEQINTIAKTLDSIDDALEKYKNQQETENLLKSKDSEIKSWEERYQKLTNDHASLEDKKNKTIGQLNKEIEGLEEKLEEALHVDGAIALNGTSDFVAKTRELMTVGRKAEQKIADFINQLNDNDANKFAYFIKQYATSMDAEKRDRWNTILSTLSIKGYINDADAIKYLQAKGSESDDAKIDWLKKFIYQEFLQNYLSSLTVMLESIRFAKKYGLSTNSDVSNEIKQLISASKNVGIKIHYVELGKDVDDYSNLVTDSKLPKGVETSCDKNIPVLVIRYGMSSDKSETKSKTEIVILD